MERDSNNEKICPYCNQKMTKEIYSDHLICHQLESEDNFNLSNNINQIQHNNNYYNRNQSQISNIPSYSNSNNSFNMQNNNNNNNNNGNNNNDENNQNEGFFSRVYNIISSPFQSQNENNNEVNSNNSSSNNNQNDSNNNTGFFSSLFGNSNNNNSEQNNNNHSNNNNDRNNNSNNPQPEQTGFFQTISNSISNAFNNLGENIKDILNPEPNYNESSSSFNSNNSYRSYMNNSPIISNNNTHYNVIRLEIPIQSSSNNNHNSNSHIAYIPYGPPIIIGERGHVIDINQFRNSLLNNINLNNNINPDELNRIMEFLPSTVLQEKKEGINNECVICLSEYEAGDSITTLPCAHIFHTECIKSWLQSKNHCPVCKFEITLNSLMRQN